MLRGIVVVGGLAVCVGLGLAPAALADTFTVTKQGDPASGVCRSNDCSLRQAVLASDNKPGKDTIVLPSSKHAYKLTIPSTAEDVNADGDLDIFDDVIITHRGKGHATIDANHVDRVFDVYTPARFTHLTLTRGEPVPDSPRAHRVTAPVGDGGAIRSTAKITIVDSVLTANMASGRGGGIDSTEKLTLSDSTISSNHSFGTGGGVSLDDGGEIGDSTISGNKAGLGGGLLLGNGPLSVENSTLTGNRASGEGGAIAVNMGDVSLNAVTVTDNTGGTGATPGSVYAGGLGPGWATSFVVRNSIVAGNRQAGGPETDCGDNIGSAGHNYFGKGGNCTATSSDLRGSNPKLGKLASNGGPTKSLAVQKHSPVIGKASKTTTPKRDQRGQKRDAHPDIGAFER